MNDVYSDESLRRITPRNIRTYLSSSGWSCRRKDEVCVFRKGGHTITVPFDDGYEGYPMDVDTTIRILRDSGDEPRLIIPGLLAGSPLTSLSYRYVPDSAGTGLIPVRDLETVLSVARGLNLYSYREMGGNRGRSERALLDRIGVGSMRPGSFIVDMTYPLLPGTGETPAGDPVMDDRCLPNLCERVSESISAVAEAAGRGRTSLDEELGISYGFVSTLGRLGFDGADVEVTGPVPMTPSRPVRLTRDVISGVRRIEDRMAPVSEESAFLGRIVNISDRRGAEDRTVGVTVRFLDGNDRPRTARLETDEVETVYRASLERSDILITGRMTGVPGSLRIEDVKDVRIVRRSRLSLCYAFMISIR